MDFSKMKGGGAALASRLWLTVSVRRTRKRELFIFIISPVDDLYYYVGRAGAQLIKILIGWAGWFGVVKDRIRLVSGWFVSVLRLISELNLKLACSRSGET